MDNKNKVCTRSEFQHILRRVIRMFRKHGLKYDFEELRKDVKLCLLYMPTVDFAVKRAFEIYTDPWWRCWGFQVRMAEYGYELE